MSNSLLKQIACIGAYAAGFTVGTYGAVKAVEAIENKWPMKRNSIRIQKSNTITFHVEPAETRGHIKAVVTKNGNAQVFTGTKRQVRVALNEHGFDQYAEQLAA